MRTRLTRDPDTGEEYLIDIETGERIYDEQYGAGVFSSLADVGRKVISKLTGKAAKEIAKKAVSKAAEKAFEKIGKKTGQLVGEKIYDKFSNKKSEPKNEKTTTETKGDKIVELLKAEQTPPTPTQSPLSIEFDNLIDM